jgi:sarcosine oxidase subunit alpha
MHVLRAEKGYIIVGQETDGTVTPDDVGLGWAIGKAKRDFVGKRSLARPAMQAAERKQLVGLEMVSGSSVLEEGAQLVDGSARTSLGHVTSAYFSAVLGRPIALAMLEGGRGRMGQVLRVPMPRGDLEVRVVNPVFYDSEGVRLHA